MVVVGAHLDHDGIDEAGRIYNGADDNASGTAAVLAMAAAFARAAARGRAARARGRLRAVERRGERDRSAPSTTPAHPVPARRVVANVNLDMIGRDEEIPDPDDPRFRGFAEDRRVAEHERRASARLQLFARPRPRRVERERNDPV